MNRKNKLKIGIIGLGKMGLMHFNVLKILNNFEIVFVADIKNKKNIEKNLFTKNFRNKLDQIDAAIIATPTSTHFNIIKIVGKKVKNIFVEKPLTHNFITTQKIINFCKSNKINLKIGFIERFNPVVSTVKKMLKNNTKIISTDFLRIDSYNSRIKDADIIIDTMIHDIDLSIYFNGMVKNIYSIGVKINEELVQANVILLHENKVYSTLFASKISQKKERSLKIISKNLLIEGDLNNKMASLYLNTKIQNKGEKSYTYTTTNRSIQTPPFDALQRELLEFSVSCNYKNKKTIFSNYYQTIEVMRVCEKIKKNINIINF